MSIASEHSRTRFTCVSTNFPIPNDHPPAIASARSGAFALQQLPCVTRNGRCRWLKPTVLFWHGHGNLPLVSQRGPVVPLEPGGAMFIMSNILHCINVRTVARVGVTLDGHRRLGFDPPGAFHISPLDSSRTSGYFIHRSLEAPTDFIYFKALLK
jgi:hypothetical protein